MRWRWQQAGLHDVGRVRRIGPVHARVPFDGVGHAQALIEVEQVGATTHQDVLAIVEHFTSARVSEAGCSATQLASCLQHGDLDA